MNLVTKKQKKCVFKHLLEFNTLFPLGPGLPSRPSGPLFPFKDISDYNDSIISISCPQRQHCGNCI